MAEKKDMLTMCCQHVLAGEHEGNVEAGATKADQKTHLEVSRLLGL